MFCLRKGTKSSTDYRLASGSANSLEGLTDNNASFLRAARAGNLEKVLEYLKGNIDINTSNANGLNALHLASKEGHVNVVTELLKRGANVNAATKKGNTALHIASLAGQYEVAKVLVNLGANVNVQSLNGFTPLYMAAQENHDNVVSFLLANGANQSLATEDGFTPLAVALQQGHDKVVAVLLENDTKGKVRLPALHIAAKKDDCKAATLLLQNDHNPDVTSKSGFTPLHIAAHYGNENIANILLDKGADVNYAAKHQITPLHVASKWGKSNMVTLLLDKRANIEASTRDGLTPLHCAARSGHDQVVDLLLERGAPILAKTKNGLAPLHMASQGDHVDSARILLYHKAPVDDVTVDYLTALHVAAHCGHVKVAKLLLDRKADPNARALNGFTPLHIACKKNRIKVVELLLKHGASIEATTESGLTPLHVASFMGCMNIVIYLIQNGANPDVPTVRGETPLHLAARANQTDIIRILLRNGANVDARAREEQTPLHIAARLGNVDIVSLLLQHGAAVDATTKDMYTALHIAAKEDQEEVASVLLDHGASLTSTTKKGFTPLHLAAKYGNIKVARLLLQKDAPVDAQGKNGVTPLHVASHYDHVNVALLLLDKGASPHAMAKNGYTPLHIAAKKNQMDIATTLLEYGAKANSESKAGFTPLHLASQDGHTDMTTLLIEHQADANFKANNGLTPLHLCAQEDRVNVATVLVKNGAEIGPQTKAGYTPLHVASHFGQINMVRFLLQQNADVHMTTSHGYTPLHQAAQQGHTLVVNLLLENQASPNVTTSQGQTALSIAQRLGYISVVETLKVVTETTVTTTTTTVTEEKYKVVAPETMQETFMTDSEDEGGGDFDDAAFFGKPTHATHIYLPYVEGQKLIMSEDVMLGDQSYRYLTADEMKSLGDDSLPIDVTKDEKQHEAIHPIKESPAPMVEEDHISPQHITPVEVGFSEKYSPDNVDLSRAPVHAGHFRDFDWDDTGYFSIPSQGMLRSSRLKWKTFLVSFMVDARGGAMRGCRHSGVRVIIPPRKASMPMRITCRYLRKEKLIHPPPLMEGEACASRILEVGPVGARFLGPVIIEVPHFASLRGKEREITILRSDTGETWREHTLEASEEAVQEVLNESFEGDELSALEDLNTNRITRILTTDFPQYFAVVTRIRQEVHGVGPEGGMVSSTVVPQVQAVFPVGALTKKIRVGLQAQPIAPELVAKLLGNRVAVSPIVTVEPRRRKFHKPITLTIPVPQAATKGMINQYSGDAPTLRLLCSITGSTKSGGSSKAQWEDVTGSTPLQFVSDCVSFTTTVSARFWLMDCRQVNEASKFATELYQEAVHVPFMSKFVIFAKRNEPNEAHLRVFCMTDDKEDKTLETQENFTEIAKSRDVEVLEGKLQYLEFAGNLVPVTKSGEQLKLAFQAFHENRLAFTIRVKDPHVEPMGRIAFMKEPKAGRGEPPQVPICNLNVALPEVVVCDSVPVTLELVTLEKRDDFIQESGLSKPESIHRADLRLSDIARELDKDWVGLAQQLEISESDINVAKSEFPDDISEQALIMLRMWLQTAGSRATGNELEKGLRKINREDIIKKCMFNVELVTDDVEKAVAKVHLDQSGFDVFKEELGSSREASMRRGASLDISYDEQDIMKDAESAAETSSETGSIFERDQISQVFSDEKENLPLLHDVSPITAIAAESEETTISPDAEMVENHINKLDNDFSVFHDITPQVSTINESEGNHKGFENITDAANWIQDDNIVSCVTQEGSENEYFSPSPSNMPNSDADTLSYSDRLNFPKNETDQHDSMELIETDILLKEEYKSYNEPQNMTDDVEFVTSNNLANIKSQMEDFKETESYFSNDDSNYSSHNEFVDNEHLSPLDTSFETSCYVISDDHHEDTEKVSSKLPFEEFTDKITAEIIEMASSAKINDEFKCDSLLDSSVPEEKFDEEEAQNSVLSLDKEVLIESDLIYDNLVNKNQLFGKDPALFADSCNAPINNVSFELNVGGSTRYTNSEIPQSAEPEIHKNIPEEVEEQVFLYEVAKPEECIGSDNAGFETDPNYDPECESSESPDDSMESLVENVDSPTSDDLHKTEGRLSPVSDNPDPTDRFIEEARIRRVSKTPPPSPAEIITKEFIEEKSTAEEKVLVENEVLEKEGIIIKEEVPTAAPKPIETVDEIMKPVIEVPEVAAKQTESETWPSGEMDTSQVSVSSLPDDEKSETTTATVSSATAADVETETKVVESKDAEDSGKDQPLLSMSPDGQESCLRTQSKIIFESTKFLPCSKMSSPHLSMLAAPEKILHLQEMPLSPVKEVSEVETKEISTSPGMGAQEIHKPSLLISTRQGFRTRKRLSPTIPPKGIEQTTPHRVDRGLSPIAVFTAGPNGVRKEESEYFIQIYDAPTMQEPEDPHNGRFCSKAIGPSPVRENEVKALTTDQKSPESSVDVEQYEKVTDTPGVSGASNEVSVTPVEGDLISPSAKDDVLQFSVSHSDMASSPMSIGKSTPVEESADFIAENNVSSTYELAEKCTSPISDYLLDTGIGTDSPVTTDTACSPLQIESVLPVGNMDHATKEHSATQTLPVDTVSAHTSPMDGSLSLADSLLSCAPTSNSGKSDTLDDLSKTLGTPSTDNEDLDLVECLPDVHLGSQENVLANKGTVKCTFVDFLEEYIVESTHTAETHIDKCQNETDQKVMESDHEATCSTHIPNGSLKFSDMPPETSVVEDKKVAELSDKVLTPEKKKSLYTTESPTFIGSDIVIDETPVGTDEKIRDSSQNTVDVVDKHFDDDTHDNEKCANSEKGSHGGVHSTSDDLTLISKAESEQPVSPSKTHVSPEIDAIYMQQAFETDQVSDKAMKDMKKYESEYESTSIKEELIVPEHDHLSSFGKQLKHKEVTVEGHSTDVSSSISISHSQADDLISEIEDEIIPVSAKEFASPAREIDVVHMQQIFDGSSPDKQNLHSLQHDVEFIKGEVSDVHAGILLKDNELGETASKTENISETGTLADNKSEVTTSEQLLKKSESSDHLVVSSTDADVKDISASVESEAVAQKHDTAVSGPEHPEEMPAESNINSLKTSLTSAKGVQITKIETVYCLVDDDIVTEVQRLRTVESSKTDTTELPEKCDVSEAVTDKAISPPQFTSATKMLSEIPCQDNSHAVSHSELVSSVESSAPERMHVKHDTMTTSACTETPKQDVGDPVKCTSSFDSSVTHDIHDTSDSLHPSESIVQQQEDKGEMISSYNDNLEYVSEDYINYADLSTACAAEGDLTIQSASSYDSAKPSDVSDLETFSAAVDEIFSKIEDDELPSPCADMPDSHKRIVTEDYPGIFMSNEDKLVLVTEATMITDKRDISDEGVSQKEGKKLVPKLRHCDAVDPKVEEWTETDDSGAVKHVIQKTTHMTLSMQQKSDDKPDEEGTTKEIIPESHVSEESEEPKLDGSTEVLEESMGNISRESSELSFAEKRDFFQRLSLSSSSPTVTPSPSLKGATTEDTAIQQPIVDDRLSPEEQLSFAERLKFFEKTDDGAENLVESMSETKTEMWTVVSQIDGKELTKDTVVSKVEEITEELVINTEGIVDSKEVKEPLDSMEQISEPSAVSETLVTTKVEVLVKKFMPGKEAVEICSIENVEGTVEEPVETLLPCSEPPEAQHVSRVEAEDTTVVKELEVVEHDEEKEHALHEKISEITSIAEEKVSEITSMAEEKILALEKKGYTEKDEELQQAEEFTRNDVINSAVTEDLVVSPAPSLTLETVKVFTLKEGEVKIMDPNSKISPDSVGDDFKVNLEFEKSALERDSFLSQRDETEILELEKEVSEFKVTEEPEIDEPLFEKTVDLKVESMISSLKRLVESKDSYSSHEAHKEETSEKEKRAFKPDVAEPSQNQSEGAPGEKEIFICTEHTLDNVKMILSAADAESSVVQDPAGSSSSAKEIFICTERTLDNVRMIMSEAEAESNVVLPHFDSFSQDERQKFIPANEEVIEPVIEEREFTKDTSELKYQEEEKEKPKSPDSSEGRSESSFSGSVKDRSIEINNVEIVPVLEVSEEISEISVDMTGHQASGTECSFHKDIPCKEHHKIKKLAGDEAASGKIPVSDMVEKAEFEDVEKMVPEIEGEKESTKEKVVQRTHTDREKTSKETLESVEITHYKEFSKEVYSVSPDQYKGKISTTQIHVEPISHEKESSDYTAATHKLDDFLKSVTQNESVNEEFFLPPNLDVVDKRTEEWIDKSGEIMLKDDSLKEYQTEGPDNGITFEERAQTFDDELQKRSSPTAESFDDEARVEKCDTDIMMQLLDFVSRSDIELAEVRTEDEAPDIEEDVSPSGEEESHPKIIQDEIKPSEKKIVEAPTDAAGQVKKQLKSDEGLRIEPDNENLLASPLRSSFDSVTSPSRKEATSDDTDITTKEVKFQEEPTVMKTTCSREFQPQSSLEVEVGSRESDDAVAREVERERDIVLLTDVEEEQHPDDIEPHLECELESTKEKHLRMETTETTSGTGDQLCMSPSPEAKSTKRTDEVFRDEAYEIMCHQSDNIVNLDFDTFEQGTAVPKKGNYVDIQEASAGLTYLDMDNNLKSQPTECDVDNVESLKDHMQPDVTGHLQGSKTYDLHFNNEPSQKVEAADFDFEQNINRDLNSPLEAKAEFHTAVRDLYSEPADIKTTDEEFFIHKQYPCELTTGSLEESVRQYKLEDLQSGVTENSDVLKQGIDVDVELGHEYMTEALKDYESGQYNISEKGVELLPDLEYQHSLEEQELEKTCKTKIFDQGSVLITELEPESGLEDVMHDEMSKPNISEPEKGSFMEIGHQYPSEDPGTHIFELETGSDVEFSHQYPFVDPEQSEICRAGVFELGTGPVTEMAHHNIREGLEARETCKTSFPDGEFEASYAVENPEHYEPGKANIPEFEIGIFTEMEHERFINNLRVTENNKTSVPEHKTETEIATNLENQCNLGKDEFGTKSEQLHSDQVQGCDESFKPCFPEEGIDLLEKSQCQHASDMFEYEEIDIPNLGEQRIETITESGNPYSIQDLELDAMKVNSEWPNLFGFTDENREKMPDDKSTEIVMPDETTPNSSISVNPETYTRYQVNIPDETKAVGQPEVTENKYELNSPFDLNTPSAPALATYSPEQTKSPSCISEIDTPQSETEIDRNEPAVEQLSDKSFENIEQNLYAASARETDESAIYGLSADGQNPMSSEVIFHPEELNYSFLKTENLGQKLVCGSTHDKEFENVQETDDLLKSRDIQDTNAGGSSHADVTPSLHEKSCTEMKFDDHYPTIAPKGDITNPEFPEELFLTEERSSPEQTYFATEQQQLKYVPFPPPTSLKNLQEEDLSGRIRSIIQQEGDLDNHTRIPGDFSLSGSYRQPDTDQEEHASPDQLKPASEVANIEVALHLPDDIQVKEEPTHVFDMQVELSKTEEHPSKETVVTQITTQTLSGPDEPEVFVQSSITTIESTTDVRGSASLEDTFSEPVRPTELQSDTFVPLAFVNTAFVGADLIDAAEETELSRSRSPYEVLREFVSEVHDQPVHTTTIFHEDVTGSGSIIQDTEISEVFVTETREYSGSEKIHDHSGQIRHVKSEVRRRPILQHIPSEISEEDLVEREICSPVSKLELSPEPPCENLVEGSDKFTTKSSVSAADSTLENIIAETRDFTSHEQASSLLHTGSEFKIYEEIHPSEVVESTEETICDETGFQTIRTTVFETVTTRQFSSSSVDVADTVKSELSSRFSDTFDQESAVGAEEIKVIIDDSMSVSSVCKTYADLTKCIEPEIGELTSPESDTGVPTSPFECASEIDLSEYDHKSGDVKDIMVDSKPLSKTEEHKDSLLTSTATFTQSFSETLNVSTAKITDSAADSTLDEKKSAHESDLSVDDSFSDIESISHTSPKKSKICDTKADIYEDTTHEPFPPQINGPVQVDYKPEYDDEEYKADQLRSICDVTKTEVLGSVSKEEAVFDDEEFGPPEEFLGAVGGMADVGFVSAEAYKEGCIPSDVHQRSDDLLADAEPGKPYYFGSVSDDTVDAEIGKILSSRAETEEDIIERPRTPEPPEEVHLPGETENLIPSADTEVFHADHPIEKTKRTIEGVLDIDVETNSLKFQLTSSTSHSEWETSGTVMAVKEQGDNVPISDSRVEEPHFESSMQLPIELSCPAVGASHDADSTLSPSITQSSCISEDSSGFVYGMQFEKEGEEQEEAMDIDSDQCSDEKDSSYTYGMRFEREHELDDEDDDIPGYGDLYTHQEEDEDVIDDGEKGKMQFSSARPLTYEKPSYSDYDTLAGRRFFGKANELDDISMSSLQEFEKLEDEIVSGRKSSIGSVDSFNGKQVHSKSGEHDDISMNSLTEFEKLERECAEAERSEAISQEVNARLSEIEEGHESQSSEASQETISDAAREDDSDVSDFDDRLNKIDKKIKEAQTNVEFFCDQSAVSILSQNTDQKSDIFSDDSLSISAAAAVKKVEELTETSSVQKLSESSADAVNLDQSGIHELLQEQIGSPTVISTTVVKEVINPDGSISKITTTVTEKKQIKISSISGDRDVMSSEQSFGLYKKEDIDQDSLHEDKSIKPDSLCGDEKFEYQDSLHEDKSADIDSLQEEVPDIMKDSLHEERALDEDSLHEMDILPDESSLSLETSLPAASDPCQDLSRSGDSEFPYAQQLQAHDQDVDTDSLKDLHVGDTLESPFATHVHEVALVDSGRVGDVMVLSTDSLERSSSAATHATYQFETESIMSSSINSVQTSDDYTMVSSTDTVDADIQISYGFGGTSMSDINFLSKDGQQKFFIDSEGNIQTQQDLNIFTDVEGNIQNTVMIPSDTNERVASDFTFSESAESDYHTCSATVTYDEGMKQVKHSTPIVRHQSEDTDESQSEYTDKSSGQFDPDVEIEEIQTVDDKGNPVTVRRIRRIVETKSQTFTTSSSGDEDVEEKFKKFLKDHAGGSDAGKGEEEFEEERRIDEKGNVIIVRTIKQQMLTEPEVHSKSFTGPNAEELSSRFIKSFQTIDPTETTEQYEKVDDDGNIIRVTQQVVMKPEMHTLTFSGPDAHRQMEEYMKEWTASQDDSRSQDLTHMESSPCSSKVTDASQLLCISSHPTSAPCDSFGSQISSGETSQAQTFETIVDSQPGSVTTRRIVTTTSTVHHIPEGDGAFSSSPIVSGETTDLRQGAQDDNCHLSSEHQSFHVNDH